MVSNTEIEIQIQLLCEESRNVKCPDLNGTPLAYPFPRFRNYYEEGMKLLQEEGVKVFSLTVGAKNDPGSAHLTHSF